MSQPYPVFRKGQSESIEFIRSNLGSYIAFRAPTGYGKTLVALMSHLGSEKVLYAVRTRNEMAPVIKEARKLGASFTVVFSGRRMCPLVRGSDVPAEDFWINCRLLRIKSMCPYYINLKFVDLDNVQILLTKSEVTDPHRLASIVVRDFSACPFFTLASLASRVQFTIVTYPYLFNESVSSIAFQDVGLDEFYVVVDEAHSLISPQSILSGEVSLEIVRECIAELSRIGYEDLSTRLRTLEEVLARVSSRRLTRIPKQDIGIDQLTVSALSDALQELKLLALRSIGDTSIENFMKTTSSISRMLRFLDLAVKDYFYVYSQTVSDSRKLYALPLGYEPIRGRLRLTRGVLLMSGTLPTKNILDKIIGSETRYLDVELSYGHVFPRENVFYAVYTPLTTSYTFRSTKMFMEYAKLVRSVFENVRKAVLAVYPSYEVMEEVVTYLGRDLAMLTESDGTKIGDVEKALLENPHMLINAVASGKIVEGVEFRDREGISLVDAVVICGVPYPYPDDYIEDFRDALRKDLGNLADTIVMDVQASIRVVQACGRAIRSERDRAFIVFADRRYLKKGFRDLIGVRYDAVLSSMSELLSSLKRFLGFS